MGRTLTTDDYHKLAEDALPREFLLTPSNQETYTDHTLAGTNWNAVRQRVSKMRVEQRKRFEELGWSLPDGAAKTPTKTPAKSPKKRATAADITKKVPLTSLNHLQRNSALASPRRRRSRRRLMMKIWLTALRRMTVPRSSCLKKMSGLLKVLKG
jgi:hypothetical protein